MKVINASKINGRYHTDTQEREFVAGLSLLELFDIVANEYPKGWKMTPIDGLEWNTEQEEYPVLKIMHVALKSVF